MDGQLLFLVLLGIISSSHQWISGSVLEVTVRRGDNITLYCDCKYSAGVYIVWFRNCSHENQPTLDLRYYKKEQKVEGNYSLNPLPRFHLLMNQSSSSYDLLILNITDSDEALYYCGTEYMNVEYDGKSIVSQYVHSHGKITKILLGNKNTADVSSWMTIVASAVTAVLINMSFIVVYHLFQKTNVPKCHQKRCETRSQTGVKQEEDLCLTQVVFWHQDRKPQQANLSH
ncbi:uncharacterized protein LOC115429004 [Sphaeramia orbicularis]|uniref:uncharacterized protein LOC115429004 n=1 Tax=Sphaeramia orbicularis TaxID=375764 RepID=UPI00117EB6CA|nr:uncharacterized protein LOC115429004 [Sphaeramia orbicularis]